MNQSEFPPLPNCIDLELTRKLLGRLPVLFVSFSETGAPTYVNPYMQQTLGITLEELIADPKLIDKLIHPDDLSKREEQQKSILNNSKEVATYLIRISCKNHGYRWFMCSTLKINGQLLSFGRDVNEHVEKDHILRQMQTVAQIGYWHYELKNPKNDPKNLDQKIFVSDTIKRIFDAPDDFNVTLNTVKKLFPEAEYASAVQKLSESVYAPGKQFALETELINFKGLKIWVRITGIGERSTGSVRAVFGTLQDITALKTIELSLLKKTNELEKANTYLDQFVHIASHDLRAPLRGIQLLTSLIEEGLPATSDKKIFENFHLLKSRVRRMDALLESLLEFNVCAANVGQLSTFNTKQAIEESFEFLCDGESVIHLEAAGDFPTIRSYHVPFQTVIRNLIQNSIKHRNGVNPLVIGAACRKTPNGYEFSITDNGPGIPAEYHKKVFEVFKTLRPRDEVEGSGMGLAIVQKVLDSLGGKIFIDPTYNSGSRFVFEWPAVTK